MQRTILGLTLRSAAPLRVSRQFQFHYAHLSTPSSPLAKNVKTTSQTATSVTAPINASHFKALVQPPDALARKKHHLKWDWHLRNFLMALVPPAMVWVFLKVIEWRFSGEIEEYGNIIPTGELMNAAIGKGSAQSDKTQTRSEQQNYFSERIEERLEHLEKEIARLKTQASVLVTEASEGRGTADSEKRDVVEKARNISRTIVRKNPTPG